MEPNKGSEHKPVKTCTITGCVKPRARKGGLCQMHAWRVKYYGDAMRERPPRALCSIEGCNRTVKGHGLCPLHLRRRKHGIPLDFCPRKLDRKRYRLKQVGVHPLADKLGRAYVHRLVLFQSLGWMIVPCLWCGSPVSFLWKNIFADHLNHDRHDNSIQNLVPSCNRCNAGRTIKNSRIRIPVYENFVWEDGTRVGT